MANTIKNQYEPDFVSLPGDTLIEILSDRQMTQVEFAKRVGLTPKHISAVIMGKASITPEVSLSFERALGIPSSFWNNRQQHYDSYQAKQNEMEELKKNLSWTRHFPCNQMSKRGWVPIEKNEMQRFKHLLNFFGVASSDAWTNIWEQTRVAYRKPMAENSDSYALFAWLRRGEIEAQAVNCKEYSLSKFRESLNEMRPLTKTDPSYFQERLVKICSECGVAVVFIPELPKTASGATRWLSPTKALLQLSLRYKRDDSLWFTFFHEAAHILLHQKKDTFIEGLDFKSEQEKEADQFAANFLIPSDKYKTFIETPRRISKVDIRKFAQDIGIAPGIVVGRLQHDKKLPQTHCNELKRTLRWAN